MKKTWTHPEHTVDTTWFHCEAALKQLRTEYERPAYPGFKYIVQLCHYIHPNRPTDLQTKNGIFIFVTSVKRHIVSEKRSVWCLTSRQQALRVLKPPAKKKRKGKSNGKNIQSKQQK